MLLTVCSDAPDEEVAVAVAVTTPSSGNIASTDTAISHGAALRTETFFTLKPPPTLV
jgi:hypothetical protein